MDLLLEFEKFQQEKAIIGDLLMAYGDIEFVVVRLLSAYFANESVAPRVLFRVKGEGPRLDVADAIMRPALEPLGLRDQWIHAISAARHCKNIRNQFAHCHWWHNENDRPGELFFMNLDQEATSKDGVLEITFRPIDLSLLQKQRYYFQYALTWLYHVDGQYRKKKGEDGSTTLDIEAPKSIPAPPLHNR